MAITINGDGSITGLSVGGLPDGTVDADTLATDSVTAAKIPDSLEKTFVSGRKNLIINGNFDVSQRGTYTSNTTTSAAYYVDRWKAGGVSTLLHTKNTAVSGLTPRVNTLKMTVPSGQTAASLQQWFEYYDQLKGVQVTLSCWMKSNIASSINLYDGSTQTHSTSHTGGGGWEKITVTATIGASASQVRAEAYTGGSVSVGSYFELAQFQLELGSTATDFEHRSYGEELALCRRYFQAHQIITHTPFCVDWGAGDRNTNMRGTFHFDVEMRTAPTQGFLGSCNWYEVNNDTNAPQSLNFTKNIMAGYNDQGANILGDSSDDAITFSAEL